MSSIEDAYGLIAGKMRLAAGDAGWQRLELHADIRNSMVSSAFSVHSAVSVDESKYVKAISDPCFLLRDDLLRTTGQRIWGLTFTLFPDGQFKIEYDYNKPEGYEESDEVITGDEINASLAGLTEQDKKPD
jgi:hypothetical protein